MKIGRVRGYIGSAVVLLAIVVFALWQWKALARFAITATAASIAHVRLSLDPVTLTPDRAVFETPTHFTSRSCDTPTVATTFQAFGRRRATAASKYR